MAADATNLASEFHVLSVLHRIGADATLTLANKKSVDIVVVRTQGQAITLDVKGTSGTTGWFVNNVAGKHGHFIVFVCYLGRIKDPSVAPEVYIVPSLDVGKLQRSYSGGKKVVHLGVMRKHKSEYQDNWKAIVDG
jgi:hypothetical protein